MLEVTWQSECRLAPGSKISEQHGLYVSGNIFVSPIKHQSCFRLNVEIEKMLQKTFLIDSWHDLICVWSAKHFA